MTDEHSEHERFCRTQIDALYREYQDRIRPYVGALVKIERTRLPKQHWIDASKFPGVDIDAIHKAR
jgi:hypothetical protein